MRQYLTFVDRDNDEITAYINEENLVYIAINHKQKNQAGVVFNKVELNEFIKYLKELQSNQINEQ
jgi:predicted AlkP superfamily phosphohydrolase/phosphomutase